MSEFAIVPLGTNAQTDISGARPGHRASFSPVHEVRTEITASVWKVVVEEGQMVAEGAELVILESMKMEIPVITEVPGVVRELHVEPAQTVQEGDLIALIDES